MWWVYVTMLDYVQIYPKSPLSPHTQNNKLNFVYNLVSDDYKKEKNRDFFFPNWPNPWVN